MVQGCQVFFSGAIGSGGSFTNATCCLDTVCGLFVIRSIGVKFDVEVEGMVDVFLLDVLLAILFFPRGHFIVSERVHREKAERDWVVQRGR